MPSDLGVLVDILWHCDRQSHALEPLREAAAGVLPSSASVAPDHRRSNRSRFITLVQAATKSRTNFAPLSLCA